MEGNQSSKAAKAAAKSWARMAGWRRGVLSGYRPGSIEPADPITLPPKQRQPTDRVTLRAMTLPATPRALPHAY